jgi:ADP-ribosylglycohydrolase
MKGAVAGDNSWGNGSAMRVSPIGVAFSTAEQVLYEAEQSAIISHDHPEGVKGAQATALAVFLARRGDGKEVIRTEIADRFGYDLSQTVDEIRPAYRFDVSCQGTVPAALIAFLDSDSYEDAVRNAISLGGDSDTLACIAGGVAEAFYGLVPAPIWNQAVEILPAELQTVLEAFYEKFGS